jgi:acetyl esterase/lipase
MVKRKTLKRAGIALLIVFLLVYSAACIWIYHNQKNLIFQPQVLSEEYHFYYEEPYSEMEVEVSDSVSLHALIFKADNTRGLIYYLHGSGGSLENLGQLPSLALANGYDMIAIDYRGFGKSDGEIPSEEEYLHDSWEVYEQLRAKYPEEQIVVYGYSFGTGLAAAIAARPNAKPKALVLEAPFYNYDDLMAHQFPWYLPSALITDYDFNTNELLMHVDCPVYLFHGKNDQDIYYESSSRLKETKEDATLILLKCADHYNMKDNKSFQESLARLLQAK